MTRANFYFITKQGKFKFQGNSSCYPSLMIKPLFELIKSVASTNAAPKRLNGKMGFYDNPDTFALSDVINSCGLTLGEVGNFCYVYEVDFVKQVITVWENKMSWVNAPTDWKERGWNCWIGKNGKYGYPNWVKGKKLYNKSFYDLIELNDSDKGRLYTFSINQKELLFAEGV